MKIAGLQRTTTLDFPGKVASTIFLDGCNFRCGFCHNPDLVVDIDPTNFLDENEVFVMLNQRKHLVDAVAITGGEPCANSGLYDLVKRLKKEGFFVKLDTNGSFPRMLRILFDHKLLDYVAMDIKTSLTQSSYDKAAGIKVNLDKIKESIDIIRNSGVDYEFRATMVPEIIDNDDLMNIAEYLKGSRKFSLQQFVRDAKMLDPSFHKSGLYEPHELREFKKILMPYFDEVEVKGI